MTGRACAQLLGLAAFGALVLPGMLLWGAQWAVSPLLHCSAAPATAPLSDGAWLLLFQRRRLTGSVCAQLLGLAVFGALVLPGILLWCTRGAVSPLRAAGNFSRALALAFGTSSSSAALPVSRPPPQRRVWLPGSLLWSCCGAPPGEQQPHEHCWQLQQERGAGLWDQHWSEGSSSAALPVTLPVPVRLHRGSMHTCKCRQLQHAAHAWHVQPLSW